MKWIYQKNSYIEPDNIIRDDYWKYIVSKKLDGDDNKKSFYGKFAYINGLFSTFKNNIDFCIGYELKEKYLFNNCFNNEFNEYFNPISIDINEFFLNNLEEMINFKFINSKNICTIHKLLCIERKFQDFYFFLDWKSILFELYISNKKFV